MHHSRQRVSMRLDDLLAIQSHNIAVIGLIEEAKINRSNKSLDVIQQEAQTNNGIIMKYDPLFRFDTLRSRQRRGRKQENLF